MIHMENKNQLKTVLSIAAVLAAIFCAAILYQSWKFSKTQAKAGPTFAAAQAAVEQTQSAPVQNRAQTAAQPAAAAMPAKVQAINGLMVDPAQAQRPFAIVVENHPRARPQSGLSQADVVYEALAEGGITRFLGIFQTQSVKNIGPVRSARTYFNDWAAELGAVYAHVGGNSDALANLRAGDYPALANADQFFNGRFFWRIKTRFAPHNVYTSTSLLNSWVSANRISPDKSYQDYLFKAETPAAKPSATVINIKFSTPQYQVKYLYDRKTNSYKRYIAGKADIDAGNKKQIMPKNVLVQIVRNWPTQTDTFLSIDMGTHESGDAFAFLDGTVTKGTWKYAGGRTRFFDGNGKELALNPGQIFIEVVPPEFESALNWK